jgi:hypothetical protein
VYPHAETDPTIAQLRVELYPHTPFSKQSAYSPLAPGETYPAEASLLYTVGDWLLRLLEPLVFVPLLRRAALARTLALIREEDETNNFIAIGPVNKCMVRCVVMKVICYQYIS